MGRIGRRQERILFIARAARIKAVAEDRGGSRAGLNLHAHVIGRLLFVSSFISFAGIASRQKLAVSVVPRGSIDSVILVQTGFN